MTNLHSYLIHLFDIKLFSTIFHLFDKKKKNGICFIKTILH